MSKSFLFRVSAFAVSFLAVAQLSLGRDWTDTTGKYKVAGTLIAMDDAEIVVKLDKPEKGRELLAFPLENLSKADREFIQSESFAKELKTADQNHSWKLRNGLTVLGKVVDFAKRDVTVQRRMGRIYVNDRPFESLPEVYRRLLPKVVEHYEGKKFESDRDFSDWVLTLKGTAKTFKCEGVLMELANGEQYGIPFFVFSDNDLKVLKPSWDQWLATHSTGTSSSESSERQRQESLYLQSQASAYQQQMQQQMQYEQMQMARLQLQLSAVTAGVVDIWEVGLYPQPGMMAYPMSVVVYASNSDIASRIALQNNPGYVVGPIRKVAGY